MTQPPAANLPQLTGDCGHSRVTQYGSPVLAWLYLMDQVSWLVQHVPHLAAATNTAAVTVSGALVYQGGRRAATGIRRWWKDHVKFTFVFSTEKLKKR